MLIAKITNATDDVHQIADVLKDVLCLVVPAIGGVAFSRKRKSDTRKGNLEPALHELLDLVRVGKWSSRKNDNFCMLATDGTVNATFVLVAILLIRLDDEDESKSTLEAENVLTGGDGIDVLT